MATPFSSFETATWAERTFAGVAVGDVRRTRRIVQIAHAMAEQPGVPIPHLFDSWSDTKAAYSVFRFPTVTPDRVQKPHRAQVARQIAEAGQTILLIEDTTTLSWSGNLPIQGLGPIGTGREHEQGFLLHSTVAVRWTAPDSAQSTRPPVDVLGLADQVYHIRTPRPEGENKQDSQARKNRARESELWSRTGKHLGKAPAGVRWERVCDRGADIYEFLAQCTELGQGFIVRAAQDRALVDAQGNDIGKLFAALSQAKPLGSFTLSLRSRPGNPARTVRLAVASLSIVLRSPRRPGQKAGRMEPVRCTVVWVVELDPPPGAEPLEWVLLTDAPVDTLEEAMEVVRKYSARWLIEEFHAALKTGLGAERLQLEAVERLFAAIAVMSLVALRLVGLRETARITPDAPAESTGLSELELRVLRARLKRPIQTVGEVALAIGRLGGHLNRKSDGLPGWKTLWRGMKRLNLLVQGVLLAPTLNKFG